MTLAFVLVDALPRREKHVYEALASLRAIRARRLLPNKVGGADIVALVEAADEQAVERLIANDLRSVPWVHSVRRIMAHHTVTGPIQRTMGEMADEAGRGKA